LGEEEETVGRSGEKKSVDAVPFGVHAHSSSRAILPCSHDAYSLHGRRGVHVSGRGLQEAEQGARLQEEDPALRRHGEWLASNSSRPSRQWELSTPVMTKLGAAVPRLRRNRTARSSQAAITQPSWIVYQASRAESAWPHIAGGPFSWWAALHVDHRVDSLRLRHFKISGTEERV